MHKCKYAIVCKLKMKKYAQNEQKYAVAPEVYAKFAKIIYTHNFAYGVDRRDC